MCIFAFIPYIYLYGFKFFIHSCFSFLTFVFVILNYNLNLLIFSILYLEYIFFVFFLIFSVGSIKKGCIFAVLKH